MNSYKVLQFDESTGQLTIEFAVGMSPLSVDVPIENGMYITGDALDTYIKGFIPTWHLERITQINAGVPNAQELKSLIQATQDTELPSALTAEQQQQNENEAMWAQVEFERKIAAALVKFGVLGSDPTSIPVSEQ